jgi:hypothetical protein
LEAICDSAALPANANADAASDEVKNWRRFTWVSNLYSRDAIENSLSDNNRSR